MNTPTLSRFFATLSLVLFTLGCAAAAQAQSQVNSPDSQFQPLNSVAGAPTLTITSATLTPGQGVLVKWSVVKPTLTQLVKKADTLLSQPARRHAVRSANNQLILKEQIS